MSLHDAYARVTPYELLFRDRGNADALVAAVEEEEAGRGADPGDPHAFVTMGAVGAFVRELEGPDAPPGSIHHYGALVFHGFHFTRADCPLFVLSTHVARYLVDGAPEGGAVPPPAPAGYLQLPQHLFWAEAGSDVPESVDGIFWSVSAAGLLHSLMVTGLRSDRPGLGVIPMPEAPLNEADSWLDADVRGDGTDFVSVMPGSDLDRLYSFTAAGETLKLLARFFAYLRAVPGGLERVEPDPDASVVLESSSAARGPEPSVLPFTRVRLDA